MEDYDGFDPQRQRTASSMRSPDLQTMLPGRTRRRKFKPTAPIPDVVEEASQQVDQADQADAVDIEPAPAAEDGACGSPAKAAKEPDVEATPSPAR